VFQIEDFIWLDAIVDKVITKHGVYPEEAEECFFNPPFKTRKATEGRYHLYGRSDGGRYLFVVFVWVGRQVKIITARDMTDKERRFFARK
jgi:uncharacterized DUF497 family protein